MTIMSKEKEIVDLLTHMKVSPKVPHAHISLYHLKVTIATLISINGFT